MAFAHLSVHHWWVTVEQAWVTAGYSQELSMIETVFWDFAESRF